MEKRYCNICGKEFDEYDVQEDYSIEKKIGYGSKHDGETLSLHICVDCMDKLIDKCKIDPVYAIEYVDENVMDLDEYMPSPQPAIKDDKIFKRIK